MIQGKWLNNLTMCMWPRVAIIVKWLAENQPSTSTQLWSPSGLSVFFFCFRVSLSGLLRGFFMHSHNSRVQWPSPHTITSMIYLFDPFARKTGQTHGLGPMRQCLSDFTIGFAFEPLGRIMVCNRWVQSRKHNIKACTYVGFSRPGGRVSCPRQHCGAT